MLIAITALFADCRAAPQRKVMTELEKKQMREQLIMEFYRAWRFKQEMDRNRLSQ